MEQQEIPNAILFLMVGTAIFYDIFQLILNFIPIAGWILSPIISLFAFLTFWLWFKFHGRSFIRPKRALAIGAGVIIEIVPVLNALPGWTVAVLFLIGTEKVGFLKKTLGRVFGENKK